MHASSSCDRPSAPPTSAHDVGAVTDAGRLLVTRAVRGLADGVVSVVLASYLTALGMSAIQVGAIVTGTLLGSAAGTLNPSSGDVSVFLPTEQAALAETVAGPARTTAFAWYSLCGSLAGAFG